MKDPPMITTDLKDVHVGTSSYRFNPLGGLSVTHSARFGLLESSLPVTIGQILEGVTTILVTLC